MWCRPPPPPTVAPYDRLSRLPAETEGDASVVKSLMSLDECVRDLYEESLRTSGPVLRGTDEVRFGRKYLGLAVLPRYVSEAIKGFVDPLNKKSLRYDYLRIVDSLRSTGHATPRGKGGGREAKRQRREDKLAARKVSDATLHEESRISMPRALPGEKVEMVIPGQRPPPESLVKPGTFLRPHTIEYGPGETAAFVAAFTPGSYGVLFNVFDELARRLPGFRPQSILDFGSGPGTALWAAQEAWTGAVSRYTGIDVSEDMILAAERFIGEMPNDRAPQKAEFLRYLAPNQPNANADLVVSAFTLSELPSDASRQTTVETLWNYTTDTLVLIDRGTPGASQMISDARDQLLKLAAAEEGAEQPAAIHTVAPFPNDKPNPTNNTPAWMHFSQRAQRPQFTMHTKHSKSNGEDTSYSYIIMRRGPRPLAQPAAAAAEAVHVDQEIARANPDKYLPSGEPRKTPEQLAQEAYGWPRIILPPMKRKGHVVADVCTAAGQIERWTFTKSHCKQAYRDARKACWGDLFPHTPMSVVVRPYYTPLEAPTPGGKEKRPRKQRRSTTLRSDD